MFYKKAIENSNILKNEYYYNLALINFTRELYLIRDSEFNYYKELFNSINSLDKDIMLLKDNVNKIINSDFLLI